MNSLTIPRAVAAKLGHYVYVYVDPRDERVFYVGKGQGSRALAHLRAAERRVQLKIQEILKEGVSPRIDILAHSLPDVQTALKIEAAAIDLLGLGNLTNAVRGHGVQFGRMPLAELSAHYQRRKVTISDPSILIRINRLYRYGMSDAELYDATRSAWVVGPHRDRVNFAMAVYEGVIREVYRITSWLPGGTTFNSRFGGVRHDRGARWEFVGVIAEDEVRRKYKNAYVGDLFPQGAQNPVAYAGVRPV